jgi:hypothetical protein
MVGAAKDQDLHQLVEDEAIGAARAVAPQWMGVLVGRQESRELVPNGLDDG